MGTGFFPGVKSGYLYFYCFLELYRNFDLIQIAFWNKTKINSTFCTSKQSKRFQKLINRFFFFVCGAATQRGSWPPRSWGFLDHIQRRTTVDRTPLDEWSARRRDLYLTTHNTHNRQISMPAVGFEPTISAGERPQTYALDRAATGTGVVAYYKYNFHCQDNSVSTT